ncbi:MAG TPA: hypothetical protein VMT56_00370 [Candidatus Bathyarchaeia archaeon]|nr:hypothetical protein [Candidatus Bathyarchaeia archaeon]
MAVTYTYLEPANISPRSVAIYYSTPSTDHFGYGLNDGVSLVNCGAWTVEVWADNGQTLSGGGTVVTYLQSPMALQLGLGLNGGTGWCGAPDYNITIPASYAKQGYLPQLSTPGLGMPVVIKKAYRIGFDLSSVALSQGGLTVIVTTYASRPGQ